MPKLTNGRVPKMRHHKIKSKTGHPGYAMVTLGGVDVHLGRWDDPESEVKYNEQIAQWLSNGKKAVEVKGAAKTIADVCTRWVAYAREYYQKGGKPTSEVRTCGSVAEGVRTLFGSMEIQDFNNTHLELLQKHWIRQGMKRKTINAYTRRVKAMFRWAVNQKFLSGGQWHEIAAVNSISRGRMGAQDAEPIGPASEDQIEAVLKVSSRRFGAMIQLQRLTGMRPGEVCIMRSCDVDMSGPVWIYKPSRYKTEHHGHSRSVAIGPKAQEILRPWIEMRQDPKQFLFSLEGKNPVFTTSYRKCLVKYCVKAGVEPFSPNRLRHSFATSILNHEDFDIKDAQVSLGHRHHSTTEIYAKTNLGRAANVAAKLG